MADAPNARPILVVDDEDDLRALLELNLAREGFEVVTAASGSEALAQAEIHQPQLVVLDLMLPDVPGTEVCRRIRANPTLAATPIIMLTARGEEIDRVVGFELGADDYVVKSSFSVREFLLRVRAVLRRAKADGRAVPSSAPVADLVHGALRIDLGGHRAFVNGDEIPLTATEFKLLHALASRPGRVLSRGQLLQDVWDMPPDINTRTVDTHVKRLREKLGGASVHLETVRGVGYRFNANAR